MSLESRAENWQSVSTTAVVTLTSDSFQMVGTATLKARLSESDRISFSFSFSVPKMLISDGFGHGRFRPKMIFRFSVSFLVETQNENTEIH